MPECYFLTGGDVCNARARKRAHMYDRFGDVLSTHRIDGEDIPDLEVCLSHHRPTVSNTLRGQLAAKRGIKFYITTTLRMSRFDVDGTVHTSELVLRSEVYTLLSIDDIEGAVDRAIARLTRCLGEFMHEGNIFVHTVHIYKFKLIK